VKWRDDYAAARQEAASSGRPLLLDFGTEDCFWCRKLDATTFRAPAVVQTLNERFVSVKVDAEKMEALVRALSVESYPTLIVASADGRVLGRHAGYADVAQLSALLEKAPARGGASVARPAGPAGEQLMLARGDHDAGRYLACLERCDRLAADHPDGPEAVEARRLAAQITTDPHKWRKVREQLDATLTTVRPKLAGDSNP
jgi:thioredoxin-like negative regulator of GroEL